MLYVGPEAYAKPLVVCQRQGYGHNNYKGFGGPVGKNTSSIIEYARKSLVVLVLRMILLSSIPRIYRLVYNRLYSFFCIYSSQY